MNVLITGSCGFIGYFVTLHFLKNNYHVFGVDNFNNYYDPLLKKFRFEKLKKNLLYKHIDIDLSRRTDYAKLKNELREREIDLVIHLAAYPGVKYSLKNPSKYIKNNIIATQNLFEFINKNENFKKQVILASTSSVYSGNPTPFDENLPIKQFLSPYAYTKFASENIANFFYNFHKFKVVILRYFTVYGVYNRPDMAVYKFFESIIKNKTIKIRGRDIKRDFTYIEDVATATFEARKLFENTKVFEIINIGSDNPIRVLDLVKMMFETVKKETKILIEDYTFFEPSETWASISKARKLLNFNPSNNLFENLQKTFESLKEYWDYCERGLYKQSGSSSK
ncbi:MAG: NAD-dependent epimerase/dehydratase family protein [bacterium]